MGHDLKFSSLGFRWSSLIGTICRSKKERVSYSKRRLTDKQIVNNAYEFIIRVEDWRVVDAVMSRKVENCCSEHHNDDNSKYVWFDIGSTLTLRTGINHHLDPAVKTSLKLTRYYCL